MYLKNYLRQTQEDIAYAGNFVS